MMYVLTGWSFFSLKTDAAELLGFDNAIPPYASARGEQVLKGVNYASAAAGIRSETGQQLVIYIIYYN